MEILPITINQAVLLISKKISEDEKFFIANSTLDELYEFGIIKELEVDEITGLSLGNKALLEDCSLYNNNSDFIAYISVSEAIDIIVEELIIYLKSK